MSELERIKAKLRALLSKTVENGCTESEALAAAEKAQELLSRYGIEADEVGAPEEWAEDYVGLGARRRPRDSLWMALGFFCNCKAWLSRTETGWRVRYFGRPCDVAVASYLHDILERAIVAALADYKRTDSYQRRRKPSTRRAALRAFEIGMSDRLKTRLVQLKWLRVGQDEALMTAFQEPIETELLRRGMAFTRLPKLLKPAARAKSDREAGRTAAEGVALNAGVAGATAATGGLIAP